MKKYKFNLGHPFFMVLDYYTWHNKKSPHDLLIEFWPK